MNKVIEYVVEALLGPLVPVAVKRPVIVSTVIAGIVGAVVFAGVYAVIVKYRRDHPPGATLTLDVGPFRIDQFRPRPNILWVFHQFTVGVHSPVPGALGGLRAEITVMEPRSFTAAPLPLALKVNSVGIHDAVIDVVRVNVNWLETGPIQWCGQSLMLSPPDVMPPGGYDEAQTGLAPLGRYVIKVTVAAGTLSASREFIFEPAKPKFAFMARPTEDGAKHGSVNPSR